MRDPSALHYNLRRAAQRNDPESFEAVREEVEKLTQEEQIEVVCHNVWYKVGGYINVLILAARKGVECFPWLLELVKSFPQEILIKLFATPSNDPDLPEYRDTVLESALRALDLEGLERVIGVYDIIKNFPRDTQHQLVAPPSVAFNNALNSVHYFRNPKGGNRLYSLFNLGDIGRDKAIIESRKFFTRVVDPLLEIMKDLPLEAKNQLYSSIHWWLWYQNRFAEEKEKIQNAIGVERPFTPIQKVLFVGSAGVAIAGGAMWLLMAAGAITGAALMTMMWPIALTATAVGISGMIGLSLYARNNPLQAMTPTTLIKRDDEQPLLGSDEKPALV